MTIQEFLLILMTKLSTEERVLMTWMVFMTFANVYMLTLGKERLYLLIEDSFTKKVVPFQLLVVVLFSWVELTIQLLWLAFQWTVLLTIIMFKYLLSRFYTESPDPP